MGTKFRVQWYSLPQNIQLTEIFRLETHLYKLVTNNIYGDNGISQKRGTVILVFDTTEGYVLEYVSDRNG